MRPAHPAPTLTDRLDRLERIERAARRRVSERRVPPSETFGVIEADIPF